MQMQVPLEKISVGCRVPDFTLPAAGGATLRLYGFFSGRPLMLVLWPGPDHPSATAALQELAARQAEFETMDSDVLVVAPAKDAEGFDADLPFPLCFDPNSQVTMAFREAAGLGAGGPAAEPTAAEPTAAERNVEDVLTALVLDANQRVLWVQQGQDLATPCLAKLAADKRAAGPEVIHEIAPILILPKVFDQGFCDELIRLWREGNPEEGTVGSADEQGEYHRVYHDRKKRLDFKIQDPALHRDLELALGQRIAPELEKAFHFANFHFERFLIVCYDAGREDFFRPHRDNLSEDTATRRFAVSVNLNDGFEGGGVLFPEYGPDRYSPEAGGALIFSCSLIHEALPVTKGERFVLLNMCRQKPKD
jgi:peroxiredoxin/predicted 2-oxoglutarate/Fe(II)-dependent dioxygenase YbiX